MTLPVSVPANMQTFGLGLASLGIAAKVLGAPPLPPGARGAGDGWLNLTLAGLVTYGVGMVLEIRNAEGARNLDRNGNGGRRDVLPARPPFVRPGQPAPEQPHTLPARLTLGVRG